jgi:transposase
MNKKGSRRYKDREWLKKKYLNEKLSPKKIAHLCHVSVKTIYNWIRRFGLDPEDYETQKRRRRQLKKTARKKRRQKAYVYKGGKCGICGYNRTTDALEFHHLDPAEKSYNIASGFGKPWRVLRKELDKCVLLCKNCHAEVHAGLIEIGEE